jgi:membrane-associated phospholipid phosphatase
MRVSEWIIVGSLAYYAALAFALRLPTRRRIVVAMAAALDAAGIWWIAGQSAALARLVRDWLPALQILIAYWMSGAFVRRPMPRVERWLASTDRAIWDRLRLDRFVERSPRFLLEALEGAYLFTYLDVPAGFLTAFLCSPGLDVDRYWTVVFAAEFGCYAMLPWIQTRPPRLREEVADATRGLTLRRLNEGLVKWASIQANTFPSGHAAGAFATALAVGAVVPAAGAAFGLAAIAISAGAVVGRYHYAIDVALGLAVALALWAI